MNLIMKIEIRENFKNKGKEINEYKKTKLKRK